MSGSFRSLEPLESSRDGGPWPVTWYRYSLNQMELTSGMAGPMCCRDKHTNTHKHILFYQSSHKIIHQAFRKIIETNGSSCVKRDSRGKQENFIKFHFSESQQCENKQHNKSLTSLAPSLRAQLESWKISRQRNYS